MTTVEKTAPGAILIASALILGTALGSQYLGGLAPCELCIVQRWPYAAAIGLSLVALTVVRRPAARSAVVALCGLAFAVGGAVAFYHLGVEEGWFAGPAGCSASAIDATTVRRSEAAAPGDPRRSLRRGTMVADGNFAGRVQSDRVRRAGGGLPLRRGAVVEARDMSRVTAEDRLPGDPDREETVARMIRVDQGGRIRRGQDLRRPARVPCPEGRRRTQSTRWPPGKPSTWRRSTG